jgi:tRNA(Ile)-lysidine synthase
LLGKFMDLHSVESILKHQLVQANFKRVLIAYSGGLDSSVLLNAVSALNLKVPVLAIHVHHGLSSNADNWLQHCQQECQRLDIPFYFEKVDLQGRGQINNTSGIELAARQARYQIFQQYLQEGDGILMAHHQDDQIETFMMRLMRGSGLTGLSAMDKQRTLGLGQLFRPLLNCSRKDLEAYAQAKSLSHIEDESNHNTEFDRNWWRQDLLPQLRNRFVQSDQSILKSVEVLKSEQQLLNDLLRPIYAGIQDAQGCLNIASLSFQPLSIQSQVIRTWLEENHLYPRLADKQLKTVLDDVVGARQDAEPEFKWQSNEIRRHNGKLYCMNTLPEINLESFPLIYDGNEYSHLPLGKLEQRIGLGLKPGRYELSLYDGSAKARPVNRPNKNLKKWFQEYAIPPWQRPYWPVLIKEGVVAAVPGLFVCQGYACEQGWQLRFKL